MNFQKIKESRIDNQHFELFKNSDNQYLTVINEVDSEEKSVQFYENYEYLFNAFPDELTEDELKAKPLTFPNDSFLMTNDSFLFPFTL